jgi:hypothetical protein
VAACRIRGDEVALDRKSKQTRLDRDRSKRGKKMFSCAKNWDSGFGFPGTRRLRLGLLGRGGLARRRKKRKKGNGPAGFQPKSQFQIRIFFSFSNLFYKL